MTIVSSNSASGPSVSARRSENATSAEVPEPYVTQFARAESSDTAESVISKDLMIIGTGLCIISKGNIVIDGHIIGDVLAEKIQIGQEAVVSGLIHARNVFVAGTVSGTIRAVSVSLNETANVTAEINHHSLTIQAGAMFEGKSRRGEGEAELLPNLDQAVDRVERTPFVFKEA